MSKPSMPPVIVSLTRSGAEIAERAAEALSDSHVFGCAHHQKGRDFTSTPDHLAMLFLAGHPIIAVCAAGIVIRALAPHLSDKWTEPPVLALSENGTPVPLLGGHHGANDIARQLAEALNTAPQITTAGDIRLGLALDEPPEGWRLGNPLDAKAVTAALLAGQKGTVTGRAPWLSSLIDGGFISVSGEGGLRVVLTVEGLPPLVYYRQSLALGLGCARGCSSEELEGLVAKTLADQGIAREEIAAIASIDLKADEAAIHDLAQAWDLPVSFFTAPQLEAEAHRLANPSEVVFAETGCHGVSEGAALALAGEDAELVITKHKTANATCALARIDRLSPGRARGSLAVVGIGPGQAAWRTPEATRLIAEAEELVGYGLYIDLLGPLADGKDRSDFPLGGEEDRCRYALEQAGQGRKVALICSGDAGIYAMGALVMELIARGDGAHGVSKAARQVEITHAPGISALQAASARSGALLGHDFCAISLSDLLTPRDVITKRVKAAAEGDFVIAFYNPVSKRRRTLLAEARDKLLEHRPADTPVLLASNLGRPEEKLTLRTLSELQVDEVDMLTVVLIGASGSSVITSGDRSVGAGGKWIYTPRGYAKKHQEAAE